MPVGTNPSGSARPSRVSTGMRPPHAGHVSSPGSSWGPSTRSLADASEMVVQSTVVAFSSWRVGGSQLLPAAGVEPLHEDPQRLQLLVGVLHGAGRAQDHHAPVVDGVVEARTGQGRARRAGSRSRTPDTSSLVARSIRLADEPCQYSRSPCRQTEVGRHERLAIDDIADMADEGAVQDRIDGRRGRTGHARADDGPWSGRWRAARRVSGRWVGLGAHGQRVAGCAHAARARDPGSVTRPCGVRAGCSGCCGTGWSGPRCA